MGADQWQTNSHRSVSFTCLHDNQLQTNIYCCFTQTTQWFVTGLCWLEIKGDKPAGGWGGECVDVVAWRCDSLHICHSLRKLSSRTCLNISYSFDLLSFNKIRIRIWIWIWRARPKTAILVQTCWWDFQAIASADSHTATVGSTIWRAPEEPSGSPGSLPSINAVISKPALGFNGPDVCFTICVDLHQVHTEVTSILANIWTNTRGNKNTRPQKYR